MPKRKYALAVGSTIFVDYEDKIKIVRGDTVSLDKNDVSEKTRRAIMNGHLVEVESKKTTSKKKDDSDIPEGFPARKLFIKEGLTFADVKELGDEELGEINKVGNKTIEAIKKWFKENNS